MDDETLVARMAAGDDGALRELFFRHSPMLAVRLRAVLPVPDIEDVLQETFLAAWSGASRYRPQGACGGWLWGIARRQAALLLRRRGPAPVSLADDVGLDQRAASDGMDAIAVRADLDRAIAGLDPREQEAWVLMYEQDRPVAEAAELMGVPPGTVKSRAHRARRILRATLGGVR